MLDQLTQYYRQTGISATQFRCSMATSCRSACSDFISAREAFVGTEYERGTLPRLLFISLDPAKDLSDRDPLKRTLEFMRDWEEAASRPEQGSPTFRRGDHWYQTHKFAFELLAPIARARGIARFNFPDVHRYFAHTNSAKCKDAGVGTRQGRTLLFENCRRFLPGEVVALRPDVIVTQGTFARESISGAFRTVRRMSTPCAQYQAEVVEMGPRSALTFNMAHPKARAGRYQREVRDAWQWYMRVGHAFMAGGDGAVWNVCSTSART